MILSICKKFEFEAGHFLPGHEGGCSNHHGHSYKLEITIAGPIKNGMVLDFGILKSIVKDRIIDVLDHKFLNDLDLPFSLCPSAENMITWIATELYHTLIDGVFLEKVRLYETSNSYAEWRRE
jgi:6-pyruvoyltetrahydropterin/6-carboxytetrahydropterin synthase